jgi:hypothetical protein
MMVEMGDFGLVVGFHGRGKLDTWAVCGGDGLCLVLK